MTTATALALGALSTVGLVAGCSSESTSTGGTNTSGGTPGADAGPVATAVPGSEIGTKDGSPTSVTLTEIYSAGAASKLIDVAYFADRNELWAVGWGNHSVYVGGLDEESPTFKKVLDPAAAHFMYKPPAIAMGDNGFWATCGDNTNEHASVGDGSNALFMGPSLWTTDMAVLGKRTSGGLGSHYDMLHNTPLCRGIAHVKGNEYWVFNSYDSSLDKYDFNKDHGPGEDDHSDGEIYRYAAGKVKGVNGGTPSHVFYDASDKFLYVADTGNGRVAKLDTTKGTKGGPLPRQFEPLDGNAMMMGTDVEDVVAKGILDKPSGIEVKNDLVYVTDAATSTFHVFDKTGKEIRKLDTGLPANSLAGFTFAGDGKIYFTDAVAGKIFRIDPL